jgi:hypothetical protein
MSTFYILCNHLAKLRISAISTVLILVLPYLGSLVKIFNCLKDKNWCKTLQSGCSRVVGGLISHPLGAGGKHALRYRDKLFNLQIHHAYRGPGGWGKGE